VPSTRKASIYSWSDSEAIGAIARSIGVRRIELPQQRIDIARATPDRRPTGRAPLESAEEDLRSPEAGHVAAAKNLGAPPGIAGPSFISDIWIGPPTGDWGAGAVN